MTSEDNLEDVNLNIQRTSTAPTNGAVPVFSGIGLTSQSTINLSSSNTLTTTIVNSDITYVGTTQLTWASLENQSSTENAEEDDDFDEEQTDGELYDSELEENDEDAEENVKRITSEPEKLVFFHKRLMKMVDYIYPDQWDFRPKDILDGAINENIYIMIIKFPSIKITNSTGRAHVIEDIYVKIVFLGFSFSASSIYGTRGKITTAEFNSGYAHSHLPNHTGFNAFCLGATSYSHLITSLAYDKWYNNPEEWEIRFEAFLFQLKSYLEWESIEGTPHRYMSNIGTGNTNHSLDDSKILRAKDLFMMLVVNFNFYNKLKFIIDSKKGLPELIMNEEVEDMIMVSSEDYCYRDHLGNFYQTLDIIKTGKVPNFSPFTFQGQKIEAVFSDIAIAEDSRKKYANRKIANYIKNELEQRFRKIWFEETFPLFARRSNLINKARETYNSSTDVFKDYTVVQSSE